MLDFTSALYLGFEHRRDQLAGWPSLSAGKPAALWEPEPARRVGREVSRLQGCEAGVVSASTLHVFWDLLGWLADRRARVYLDSGAYPIAIWGAEHAAARGAPLTRFRHYDVNDLEERLRIPATRRPVVVLDGFCPVCGSPAPLPELLQCVRRAGGLLVVDDTQGLGIFGRIARDHPYGIGGGGSLCWSGFQREEDVMVISSLAKAFGTPLAVLSGPERLIRDFEQASETRVHCTPPSMAAIAAAISALDRNRVEGDSLRRKLAAMVRRLRARLAAPPSSRGIFPFQIMAHRGSSQLHRALAARGVQTILRGGPGEQPFIGILLTAKHTPFAVDTLTDYVNRYLEDTCLVC